jgi:uncharacterized membrane protein
MSSATEPVLFEAVTTPVRGQPRPSVRLLAILLGLPAAFTAGMFLWLGAWPILGFCGLEVGLVVGLYALHQRRTARSMEMVVLTGSRLAVRHSDGSGAWREEALEPYWARLQFRERPGRVSELRLVQRERSIEIGRFLGEEEKRALAEALDGALRLYRQPRFDNPKL